MNEIEPNQELIEQDEARKRGRPPGAKNKLSDPDSLLRAELLEMLRLSRKAREFAEAQLQRLQDAAEGADSIKTKLEISRAAVEMSEKISKSVGNIIEQIRKQPTSDGEDKDGEFSLEKFLESQK